MIIIHVEHDHQFMLSSLMSIYIINYKINIFNQKHLSIFLFFLKRKKLCVVLFILKNKALGEFCNLFKIL